MLHNDIKEVSMFMLRILTARQSLESFHKLPACAFLFFGVFWGPARLLPFIIYVIENVIYVSVNFELQPIRPVVNLSPKLAPSVHSYTLWLGPLINLAKLEAEVPDFPRGHLSWKKKVKDLESEGT